SAGAPPLLYVLGKVPQSPCLAVVGTRKPTDYGRRQARRLVSELAPSRLGIVSGLARGIDAVAHEAALEAGLPTVAVLGSGLDCIYPAEHQGLARRIVEACGALVSQFSLQASPDKRRFPMRNGVISGLSAG